MSLFALQQRGIRDDVGDLETLIEKQIKSTDFDDVYARGQIEQLEQRVETLVTICSRLLTIIHRNGDIHLDEISSMLPGWMDLEEVDPKELDLV